MRRAAKGISFCNYSAHTVHDHSPALDSGFRRNDVSGQAFPTLVIPAKAGIQVFSGSAEQLLRFFIFLRALRALRGEKNDIKSERTGLYVDSCTALVVFEI
ncbi:hypothetical protein [Desulfonatronum parangueonense]